MLKPVVFISARISKQALELLQQHCTVRLNEAKHPLSVSELSEAVGGAEGLLCSFRDPLNSEFMEKASHLKVISSFSAGYDNIDVETATKFGIAVTNTSKAVMDATADLTWGLLIAVARRIVEGDKYVRKEQRGQTEPPGVMKGSDIFGKTLGIIGMGHIGQAVARRAKGFEMPILYYRRHRLDSSLKKELNGKYTTLRGLLENSDFVSLHVPLSKSTKYLISEKELKMMKDTAFLINTSRGPVINEKDLVRALQEKWVAGAALDVYEYEPSITKGLTSLENVVVTPHIGGLTPQTLRNMSLLAAQNLLDVVSGQHSPNIVNPEVFK